jgi:excinuclease UvrABC nuclease subunit
MAQVPDMMQLDFDPAGDFDAFARQAPAKWAVYLLADESDRPLQLLCVKNLRYSLKRRLGGDENLLLNKRVNYRQIVRRVYWQRVHSTFEADTVYLKIARQIFPDTYRAMVGFRPAWFIHVNPESDFPRYVKTSELSARPGIYLGPLEDKHAAARLIELVEDAFDLCRYYNILIEAPHGRACAYKEMGKCPAPCDGSITIAQYRRMIDWSARTIADPREFIREQTQRMDSAAAEQRYETAAKIKTFVKQISEFGKGAYRHVRRLEDLAFITLQSGPTPGSAQIFLIIRGQIEQIACLIAEPARPSELMAAILAAAEQLQSSATDADQIGVVSHHLFTNKQIAGIFLPLADISEKAILKAYKDVSRLKQPQDVEGEGVTKELQAM